LEYADKTTAQLLQDIDHWCPVP